MKTSLSRAVGEVAEASADLAREVMVLYPELPAANLVEHIVDLAEPEFLAELDAMLRARHFLGVIRAERAKERREQREAEWLFPELREAVCALPLGVPIGGGKVVARGDLRFPDTGRYLKLLDKRHRDRRAEDERRAAITLIRRLWPRSKRARRMTLSEVDLVKARRAGLVV